MRRMHRVAKMIALAIMLIGGATGCRSGNPLARPANEIAQTVVMPSDMPSNPANLNAGDIKPHARPQVPDYALRPAAKSTPQASLAQKSAAVRNAVSNPVATAAVTDQLPDSPRSVDAVQNAYAQSVDEQEYPVQSTGFVMPDKIVLPDDKTLPSKLAESGKEPALDPASSLAPGPQSPPQSSVATVVPISQSGPSQPNFLVTRPKQTPWLKIDGVTPGGGTVMVAAFTTSDGFPYSVAQKTIQLPAKRSTLKTELDMSGTVALAVFQDIDGNGVLTRGKFGAPREPFGFSNQAKAKRRAPAFADAAVTVVSGTAQIISVQLSQPR